MKIKHINSFILTSSSVLSMKTIDKKIISTFQLMMSDDIDDDKRWHRLGPPLTVVNEESDNKIWGLLCICIDVDTVTKWAFRCSISVLVSMQLSSNKNVTQHLCRYWHKYRAMSLDNCVDINVDVKRHCSTSTSTTLSSLSTIALTSIKVQNNKKVTWHLHRYRCRYKVV